MRIFLAIDLPLELRVRLSRIAEEFDVEGFAAVKEGNIHITVQFIGDLGHKSLKPVEKYRPTGSLRKSFGVGISGISYFGTRMPRVVYANVDDSGGNIRKINEDFSSYLESYGIAVKREDRFVPHVTLGRVKSPQGLDKIYALLSTYKDTEFGNFTVDRLYIKKSELHGEGPVYSNVFCFKLYL
jgi:2'-5' RNA ligase